MATSELPQLQTAREFVVFAPSRQTCYIADVDDHASIEIAAQIAQKSLSEPGLISLLPVVGGRNGWRPYEVEPGHPAHAALADLHIVDRLGAYGSQKQHLGAALGDDVFIATFTAFNDPNTERAGSYSVWSNDVVTLLPETEYVAFFDEERQPIFVAWDQVRELVGHRMTPTQHEPPRHFVDSFPDDAEWSALAQHSTDITS